MGTRNKDMSTSWNFVRIPEKLGCCFLIISSNHNHIVHFLAISNEAFPRVLNFQDVVCVEYFDGQVVLMLQLDYLPQNLQSYGDFRINFKRCSVDSLVMIKLTKLGKNSWDCCLY